MKQYYSWGNDFRHTEPCYGFSVNLLSLMTLRHLASEKPFWIWTSLQHSKGRVGRTCASLYPCSYLSGLRKKDCFSTLTFGHDILPTQWPWISCRGNFSPVLLGIFRHPYPTLVQFCFHPYSHLETPIVLSGKPETSFYLDNWDAPKWNYFKKSLVWRFWWYLAGNRGFLYP